jgi:pSer/pThr/pTyr-binding forkhead associated (FHA) protein
MSVNFLSASNPIMSDKEHFLIVEDDKGRQEIILINPNYSIGRGKNSDIQLRSQFVSRYHANLLRCLREDGTVYYRIVDGDGKGNKSTNGLLINGQKQETHDLKHGDEIVFGPQVFAIYQYDYKNKPPFPPQDEPPDLTSFETIGIEED